MFLAVPGRSPAWASPPSGEAGPGKAVLVATGFLWAGADRGRLLMLRSVCMRRDIVGGRLRCPSAFACASALPTARSQRLTGGLLASRGVLALVLGPSWRSPFAEECSDVSRTR